MHEPYGLKVVASLGTLVVMRRCLVNSRQLFASARPVDFSGFVHYYGRELISYLMELPERVDSEEDKADVSYDASWRAPAL